MYERRIDISEYQTSICWFLGMCCQVRAAASQMQWSLVLLLFYKLLFGPMQALPKISEIPNSAGNLALSQTRHQSSAKEAKWSVIWESKMWPFNFFQRSSPDTSGTMVTYCHSVFLHRCLKSQAKGTTALMCWCMSMLSSKLSKFFCYSFKCMKDQQGNWNQRNTH